MFLQDTTIIVENNHDNNLSHCFITINKEDDRSGTYSDYYAVPNEYTHLLDHWVRECYGELYSWRPSTPPERIDHEAKLLTLKRITDLSPDEYFKYFFSNFYENLERVSHVYDVLRAYQEGFKLAETKSPYTTQRIKDLEHEIRVLKTEMVNTNTAHDMFVKMLIKANKEQSRLTDEDY